MSGKPGLDRIARADGTGDDDATAVKFLAVGNCEEWHQKGHALQGDGIVYLPFEEVNEDTIGFYQPSMVYSPVLARDFDCIDLALRLHGLGFSGVYRAVAPDLPNPKLIEGEVRQLCPQLDFRVALSI